MLFVKSFIAVAIDKNIPADVTSAGRLDIGFVPVRPECFSAAVSGIRIVQITFRG